MYKIGYNRETKTKNKRMLFQVPAAGAWGKGLSQKGSVCAL